MLKGRNGFMVMKYTRQSKFLQVFSNSLEEEDKTVHIKETSPLFSLLNGPWTKRSTSGSCGRPMGFMVVATPTPMVFVKSVANSVVHRNIISQSEGRQADRERRRSD